MKTLAAALGLLALLAAGCGRKAVDPVACLPPGTRAIAGVRLDEAARSPALARLRQKLPGAEGARFALAAWSGEELLVAAEGSFATPPAGAAMAAPNLALFGAPARVQAALAQYRSGETGAPDLAAHIPTGRALWAVLRSDAALPLAGNASNLNRVLRMADYTVLGLRLGPPIELEAEGVCAGEAEAERLRATVGAMLLLANPGARPALERRGTSVRVSLALSDEAAEKWLRALGGA